MLSRSPLQDQTKSATANDPRRDPGRTVAKLPLRGGCTSLDSLRGYMPRARGHERAPIRGSAVSVRQLYKTRWQTSLAAQIRDQSGNCMRQQRCRHRTRGKWPKVGARIACPRLSDRWLRGRDTRRCSQHAGDRIALFAAQIALQFDDRGAPSQSRCAARRRRGSVRGHVSALLHPRARGTSHRTARTTRWQSVAASRSTRTKHPEEERGIGQPAVGGRQVNPCAVEAFTR
jgi:hypothetical protein